MTFATDCGRDVHVLSRASDISDFMNTRRATAICYRCGQPGHLRYQCMRYKVRLCSHYTQHKVCPVENCAFAHGEAELRYPWKMRCVRVVKQHGKLLCIGCNSSTHTFRRCPSYQQWFAS